jgi:hypothetical protein
MRRTSVTLTAAQERAITEFAQPGPYRDELTAWARDRDIELGDSFSEATLVRLLIDAGIEHVRARSVEVVYTELAEIYVDEGLAHEIKALRSETLAAERRAGDGPAEASGGAGATGTGRTATGGSGAGGSGAGGSGAGGTGSGRAGARP